MNFISFTIKFLIVFFTIEFRDSENQYLLGAINIINIIEIQFNWVWAVVLGSKDENRLLKIFFRKTSLFL
jgi:hypothetical protein